MLKPKKAFGDVTEEVVCAAGIVAAMMTSAPTSVSARTRRAGMAPSRWRPYSITCPGRLLDGRAHRRRPGLGDRPRKRGAGDVDRARGVGAVEARVGDRIERVGNRGVAGRRRAWRKAVATARRTGERR